jgi:hypothetical protein
MNQNETPLEIMIEFLTQSYSPNMSLHYYKNQLRIEFPEYIGHDDLDEALDYIPQIHDEYMDNERQCRDEYHDEFGDHLYYIPPSEY